jgi:hypothetical protein
MPSVGFEPTVSVLGLAKRFLALRLVQVAFILMSDTTFHTHTEPQAKLWFPIF